MKNAAPGGEPSVFVGFARRASQLAGSPWAFIGAVTIIVLWGLTGPLFRFSDGWQLVVNTGTTIITFLMLFLIQNTQNRDAKAIHLKLDELLRGVEGARTGLIDLEDLSDEELAKLQKQFVALHARAARGDGRVESRRAKAGRIETARGGDEAGAGAEIDEDGPRR